MKFKSILSHLLLLSCILVCLFGMCACDDDDDPTDNEPTQTPTPTLPTATPSPTPMTNQGWIAGHAVVLVSNASTPPNSEQDKGNIFSLDGVNCETAWVRLRAKGGQAYYQAKATGNTQYNDPCWGEVNYNYMSLSADGEWQVNWNSDGGRTRVTFTPPNGDSETIEVPYVMAFNHITPNVSGCTRPPVAGQTNAVPLVFQGTQEGTSTTCPY